MEVGEYIRQLRLANNLTLEELGKKLGVQSSAVAKWENGRVKNLKRETIQQLAIIFNVSPASFIKVAEPKKELPSDSPQMKLINIFSKLNPENKKRLLELAIIFLQSQSDE